MSNDGSEVQIVAVWNVTDEILVWMKPDNKICHYSYDNYLHIFINLFKSYIYWREDRGDKKNPNLQPSLLCEARGIIAIRYHLIKQICQSHGHIEHFRKDKDIKKGEFFILSLEIFQWINPLSQQDQLLWHCISKMHLLYFFFHFTEKKKKNSSSIGTYGSMSYEETY